ncbi:hypothetical protein [Sporolactobacillus shoreae]|nr:hypothetical protein [Sporolactobacillus shoreae]
MNPQMSTANGCIAPARKKRSDFNRDGIVQEFHLIPSFKTII